MRRWRERAAAAQTDDDGIARLYRTAERALAAAGYRHYEIANWARPGRECRHNLVYWRNEEWLGLGMGAHTHLDGTRSRRSSALMRYLESIERAEPRISDPSADDATDTAMLALRLDEGLDTVTYARRFGDAAASRLGEALVASSELGLVRWSGQVARLTPRGRLLASEVFVRLLPDTPRSDDAVALAAS